MLEVDGSYGEGGGQLVRTAVALSALTGTPVRFSNVRAGRARPGLAPQHLAAVQAVAGLCGARCEGLALRTTAFTFEPREAPAGGEVRVDIGTAGSVTLVLQALLPMLLGASRPSRVTVIGGTDVRQAPTWDYFCEVLLALLRRMKLDVRASLVRRGYYPRGGGEAIVELTPGVPRALVLEEENRECWVSGAAHVANLPVSIAERMRDSALNGLMAKESPGRKISVSVKRVDPSEAVGTGGAITLWAHGEAGVLGASRVAERGVRAEALGTAVGAEMAADLAGGAALDVHAADQVLVYMAIARDASSFTVREMTSHARTAMWLLQKFLPVRFLVERDGALWRVRSVPR